MRPSTARPFVARAVLRLALALPLAWALGCGGDGSGPGSLDGGTPDANPYAARTYSAIACPLPPRPSAILLCDRGDGQVPRMVEVEVCMVEVGGDPKRTTGFTNTHPQYQTCLRSTRVGLLTIADVWRAVHGRDT